MKTKANKLSEKIIEHLLNNGNGKREITEESIAARFRVSRTPVREVLKHLEHDGIIQTRKNRGIIFKDFSEEDIDNIYAVRLALEDIAVREAAKNATPEFIRRLKTYARTYRQSRQKQNRMEGERVDRLFHETIIDLSGNWYLSHLVKKIRMFSTSFIFLRGITSYAKKDLNPYSHNKIIQSLASGNPEKAAETIKKHILWSKEGMLKAVKERKKEEKNESEEI